MSNMTTEQWLSRAILIKKRVEVLKEEQSRMLELATHTVNRSGIVVQKGNENVMEKKMIEYAEYAGKIQARIAELLKAKTEILEVIEKVTEPQEELLLTLRYLRNLTWERIAEEMYMSDYWVRTGLKRKALQSAETVLHDLRYNKSR